MKIDGAPPLRKRGPLSRKSPGPSMPSCGGSFRQATTATRRSGSPRRRRSIGADYLCASASLWMGGVSPLV